jgi:putative peptidoglycan lipid II flippase
MASGTLASRLTGQIRTILLAGAIGVTGVAADAYQVGSQMPQVVYNLLAGGLLNAILVPQIIKAFQKRDSSSRINKLLTLSIIILFAFTAVLMVATPILVNIYVNSGWTPSQKALANAFTLWCMPQIFFYGLYTVVGQVLAAKDKFAAYAWSSVAANIVSCIGFGIFIAMFGNAKSQPLDFWTNGKMALTAGTWTLGVAMQALILLIPLSKLGLKLRFEFGFRGIGLRSMGKVAAWTLGMMVFDQLLGILNTRITTGAPVVTGDRLGTAGSQAYMQAYQIWILPYSLITVSLATAIFPRLSRAIADHRIGDARTELSSSLRTSGVLMVFFTAAFLAIPTPIIRSLLPSVGVHDAKLMAIGLIGLSIGLLPCSVNLLLRRAFYAFEDGRSPFFVALAQNGVQAVMMLTATHFLDAHYWVAVPGACIALSNVLIVFIPYMFLRKRMNGRIDGKRILTTYAKTAVAGAVTTVLGILFSRVCERLVGADINGSTPTLGWVQAVTISALVGIAMLVVYMVMLYVLHVPEATSMLAGVSARVKRLLHRGSQSAKATATPGPAPSAKPTGRTVTSSPSAATAQNRENSSVPQPPQTARPGRMTPRTSVGSVRHMIPAIGDTINNRYTLIALYRSEPGLSAWLANDHTLVRDCQLFIISDSSKLAKVNAIASSLALSRDSHFTHVLHLQKQSGVSIIVTETDAGISLHELLSNTSHSPLGIEAMRTITGETVLAADSLRKVSLNHQAISTHIIRLTSTAVTLADAPVSPLLTTAVKRSSFNESDESLAVRQIGAVLYEMITKTAYSPNSDPETIRRTFAAYHDTIPVEFISICTRALGIPQEDGTVPVPLFTLQELLVLLGTWQKPSELDSDQIDLPSKQAAASIESATLAPVEPRNIVDIPDSLVADDAADQVHAQQSDQSPWRANQLLFAGADAVEEINSDSPNFLSAFESSFQNSVDQLDHVDAGFGTGLTSDELATARPTEAMRVTHPTQSLSGEADDTPENAQTPTPGTSNSGAATPSGSGSASGSGTGPSGLNFGSSSSSGAASDSAIPLPSPQELAAAGMTAAAASGAGSEQGKTGSPTPAQTGTPTSSPISSPTSAAATSAAETVSGDDEDAGEVTAIIQPIPPTFAPAVEKERLKEAQAKTAQRKEARKNGEKTPKRRNFGRNTAIVIAGIALVGALIWAISAVGLTPRSSTANSNGWTVDVNNTPLPDGSMPKTTDSDTASSDSNTSNKAKSNADSSSSDSSADTAKKKTTETVETKDKNASKVPTPATPKVTNTTAYAISNTSVIRNVSGLKGIGIHVHLSKAQPVQRVQITARTGGGKASLYANSTATNPNNGDSLADFSFKEGGKVTQVTLAQPVTTQDLVIWVSQQPTSGFFYTAIKVY